MPNGFPNYRAALRTVATALGGSERAVIAVAEDFQDSLDRQMTAGQADPWKGRGQWWRATDEQLVLAALSGTRAMIWAHADSPIDFQASWEGAMLTVRGSKAFLEGGGYSLFFAGATAPSGGRELKWSVALYKIGKTLANAYGTSAPSSTYAQSEEGARKALKRMVETFFKVKMQATQ